MPLKKTWFSFVKALVYHCLEFQYELHNFDLLVAMSRRKQCVFQHFSQQIQQKSTNLRFGIVHTDHINAKIHWNKTYSPG